MEQPERQPEREPAAALSPELRALLVCPVCRGELDDVAGGLRCPTDGTFPIVDGVPFLLPERAERS